MEKKVKHLHPSNGLIKQGFLAFAGNIFFWMVCTFFQGEMEVAALRLLFTICTLGFWQLIVCCRGKKQYMTPIIEKGYALNDGESVMNAARMKLGIAEPV